MTVKAKDKFNLDQKDIQILSQLDINCRNSYGNISKKVHKSKEFVRYRIERLLENQVIDSFITSIDYSKLGMYRICLYIKFKEINEEIKKKLKQYKNKRFCRMKFFSVGSFDLFVDWIMQEGDNANAIAHNFMSQFGDQIDKMSMNVLYKIKHYRNRYLYGEEVCKPFISAYTESKKVKISDKEMQILSILSDDPRIQIIDIAKKCKLSPKTIITKINNLKKLGVLKGFCIKLNNTKVKKEDYIILLRLNDKSEKTKSKIESYLDSINEVSYMGKLIGELDMEFSITANSQEEFIKIFDEMRSNLKKEIKESFVLFLTP